jgi:hypothetical protein
VSGDGREDWKRLIASSRISPEDAAATIETAARFIAAVAARIEQSEGG